MSEYTDKIAKIFLNNKKEENCEICIICGHKIHYDVETYYDINGAEVCNSCMSTVCEIKPIKDGNTRNLTDEETDIYNNRLEAEAETIDEISLL